MLNGEKSALRNDKEIAEALPMIETQIYLNVKLKLLGFAGALRLPWCYLSLTDGLQNFIRQGGLPCSGGALLQLLNRASSDKNRGYLFSSQQPTQR